MGKYSKELRIAIDYGLWLALKDDSDNSRIKMAARVRQILSDFYSGKLHYRQQRQVKPVPTMRAE